MRAAALGFGRRRLFALAASLLLANSACADDDLGKAPAAAPDAKPGGTLTVAISTPTSIEPSHVADPSGALVVRTMCDPLIQIDPKTGSLRPAIAESWLISDGGRRFTIKLRKGVKFHNGREVEAEDVVFSLSRVASEEAASPLAPLLRQVEGYEKFHGEDKTGQKRRRESLSGMRVISKYGVEIALAEPNAEFIRLLAHPLASPVPKEVVKSNPRAFATKPVCAGPYAMAVSWTPSGVDPAVIRLRRFADYRPVNLGYTGEGRGYVDTVEFRLFPDLDAQFSQFQAGILDVAHLPPSRVAEGAALGPALLKATGPSLEYIGLPNRTPPFDERQVRVALSRALDRDVIAQKVRGGTVTPAHGFLPPTLGAAHRPRACGALAPATADVSGAQASLARAGVDLNGVTMRLFFNDEFGHRALIEDVGRQWREAFGLVVEPVPMPWEPYMAALVSTAGLDGAFRLSWAAPYPSADSYLGPLFHSGSSRSDNLSGFSDADFDRLLDRVARRSEDPRDRLLDYQRLEDLVCREMPIIPIDFAKTNHLVNWSRIGSARATMTDTSTGEVLTRELFIK